MKNVMYKIIMGCYIVAALVLVAACNDSLDIQQATRSALKRYQYQETKSRGNRRNTLPNWCVAAITNRLPIRYAISSRTAKGSWKWTTVRCSYPMTFIRWRKKRSGSTTPRHRPTSRRLTFISSTASGRCSNLHYHLIMTTAKKKRKQ